MSDKLNSIHWKTVGVTSVVTLAVVFVGLFASGFFAPPVKTERIIPKEGTPLTFLSHTPKLVWYMNTQCVVCRSEYPFIKELSQMKDHNMIIINREDPNKIRLYLETMGIVGVPMLDPVGLKRTDTNVIPLIVLMKDGKVLKTFLGKTTETQRAEIKAHVEKCQSCSL